MNFDYDHYLSSLTPWFYGGIALVLLSVILFEYHNNKRLALLFLVAGNLLMSGTYSVMQPFLHLWDEQVHALVAKNMMTYPFKPMLIANPHLDYDYKIWLGNHVWLHKQPWFLWQIALSFRLFGISEFTLRIPSMLMFSGLLLMVYRMGVVIKNKNTGFYAAVLLAGSNFLLQLVTGAKATDHNDVAFVFYVTASMWAWFEFENKGKRHWLILTGLFSGIAILNKWLPGLLVYSGWFFAILFSKERRKQWKTYSDMLLSIFVTIITALPWQLYILWRFPKESLYEYGLNSLHFLQSIEKHKGDYFFHFDHLATIYGDYFKYIISAALILLLFIKVKKSFKIAVFTYVIIVYTFYTFASTKMIAFPFIVAPLIYIVVGAGLSSIIEIIKVPAHRGKGFVRMFKPVLTILILSFMFINFLNLPHLLLTSSKSPRALFEKKIRYTLLYKKLPQMLGKGEYEFFYCRNFDHIKLMFYTDYNAHGYLPNKKQTAKLTEKNITPVVFDNGRLPKWIVGDKRIIKLKTYVWLEKYLGKPETYR